MVNVVDNYNLATRNTFRMNVSCKRWIDYDSPADIPYILSSVDEEWKHIGGGSNILFTKNYDGTILHSSIKGLSLDGDVLNVGAGERLDDVVAWCCDRGLWGLENLSGIPGEIGGAAIQNAGAYGVEICDCILSVSVYDTVERKFVELPVAACEYSYRNSMLKKASNRYIVASLKLGLSSDGAPKLTHGGLAAVNDDGGLTPTKVREIVIGIRNDKLPDPSIVGSAGSFFKNPVITIGRYRNLARVYPDMPHYTVSDGVKIPAAWLIDRSGLKGISAGGASTWESQPLVLVNKTGKASAEDIVSLEQMIVAAVRSKFGITLTAEVEHI